MKTFFCLFVICLAGCAVPEEQLRAEAKECVNRAFSVSEKGVIGDPTDEQTTACWAPYNKRADQLEKIRERKRKEREQAAYYRSLCRTGAPIIKVWGSEKRFAGCATRVTDVF